MKHIHIRALAALLATLFVLTSVPTVHALPPEQAGSTATVEFTMGEGPTAPVNPEQPTDPADPDNPGEGVTGSLAIVDVSNFSFGSLPVTTSQIVAKITTIQPNIQVVDLRGTGKGWKLSAKLSDFTAADGEPGEFSLPGASIHIADGRPNSPSFGAGPAYAPVQSPVTLVSGDTDESEVITAAAGKGMGLWVMRWYPESAGENNDVFITLNVPLNAALIGVHSATINWVLSSEPTG